MKKYRFLVVDDSDLVRSSLCLSLRKYGSVDVAIDPPQAFALLKEAMYDLAFVDLNLVNKNDGFDVLKKVVERDIYPVVLSGSKSGKDIQRAYEMGCEDYFLKGDQSQNVDRILNRFFQSHRKNDLEGFFLNEFITQDDRMRESLKFLGSDLNQMPPVLLLGPTGTGKTAIARKIYEASGLSGQFVEINCAAIPEELLESELFGHKKGAFTGAHQDKDGLFVRANGGILFLDEIGSLSLKLQAKLLTAIERKEFIPLGSTNVVTSDFKLISATCENIRTMVQDRVFREDLFYRLSGVTIDIPPLCDRPEDVILLLQHYVDQSCRKIIFDTAALDVLKQYSWPGNVRELKTIVETLALHARGIVKPEDLPDRFQKTRNEPKKEEMLLTPEIKKMVLSNGLHETMDLLRTNIVQFITDQNGGKVNQTLADLKISSSSYYNILEKGQSATGNARKKSELK